MRRFLGAVIAAVLLVMSTPAWAHKLKVFAQAEGGDLVGTAYFAGGGKAMGADGAVKTPDGQIAATFKTAPDGTFRVAVTQRLDYTITVDSGDGHVAETVVRSETLPAGPSKPGDEGAGEATVSRAVAVPDLPRLVEEAVARQIRPLREQLDEAESRARFSDIVGGIGVIFGLFGGAAWWSSRRRP